MNKFLLAGILSAGLVLTGCNGGTPSQINPTYGGPQGQCVEADGEPCDDDPFDIRGLVLHDRPDDALDLAVVERRRAALSIGLLEGGQHLVVVESQMPELARL